MRRAFGSDQRGSIAVIFALALLPLIALGGTAVDYSMAANVQTQLQTTADAAALAAAKRMGVLRTPEELQAYAESWIAGHTDPRISMQITAFEPDWTELSVRLELTSTVSTAFVKLIGVKTVPVSVGSTASNEITPIEVVLALDNSGSMGGNRITQLKAATKRLAATLFAASTKPDVVRIGLVPFAASVNVGPENQSQSWLDQNGASPAHSRDFSSPANRFSLYAGLKDQNGAPIAWAGCVEARPDGLDVTDDIPGSSPGGGVLPGATLFLPSFAPDEPGEGGGGNVYAPNSVFEADPPTDDPIGFENDYLNDDDPGSVCTPADLSQNGLDDRQARVCKYSGATALVTRNELFGSISGPNRGCTSSKILPLTNSHAAVDAAVNAMGAEGGTNIPEGFAWAWRVISPGLPFSEGRSYDETRRGKVRKNLIVMSDGESTIEVLDGYTCRRAPCAGMTFQNPNNSVYMAYGYTDPRGTAHDYPLGTPTRDRAVYVSRMDQKLLAACANAKSPEAGVTIDIYTIGFDIPAAAEATMQACASSPDKFYKVSHESELVDVFERIAKEIAQLRISK